MDYSSDGVAGWCLVYLVKLHRAKLYRFSKNVWSETLSETFFHYMCIEDTRRSLHKLLCQNLLERFPSCCCGNAALSLSICFGYIWDIIRMSSLKHKMWIERTLVVQTMSQTSSERLMYVCVQVWKWLHGFLFCN